MFTGIIEEMGLLAFMEEWGSNKRLRIQSSFADALRPDESVAHNGVCLTVETLFEGGYEVSVIEETLSRTNLGELHVGDHLNLERSLAVGSRMDGHFVQGHVDACGTVERLVELDGSDEYFVRFPAKFEPLLVEKGSICVNGISLTVAKSLPDEHVFSVCIIPHTRKKTNVSDWKLGERVNLEFDILGKYVQKFSALRA